MGAKPTVVQLILNATTAGKAMLTAANAAAQRTLLGVADLTGASATVAGAEGRVVQPIAGDNLSALAGDATWRSMRPRLGVGGTGTYYEANGNDISINAGLLPPWALFGTGNGQNFAARSHFVPYHTERPFSLTKVRYYVNANNNANPAKLAVYTASRTTGFPETRIGTVETLAVDTIAFYEVTLSAAKSIPAGWFWVGFVTTSSTNLMCVDCRIATNYLLGLVNTGASASAGGGSGVVGVDASYAAALPATVVPSSTFRINPATGSYYAGFAPWIVLK